MEQMDLDKIHATFPSHPTNIDVEGYILFAQVAFYFIEKRREKGLIKRFR